MSESDCPVTRLSFWKRTLPLHSADTVATTKGRFYLFTDLRSLNKALGTEDSGPWKAACAALATLYGLSWAVYTKWVPFSHPCEGALPGEPCCATCLAPCSFSSPAPSSSLTTGGRGTELSVCNAMWAGNTGRTPSSPHASPRASYTRASLSQEK